MIRVTRPFVVLLALAALVACKAPSPSTNSSGAPTADVSGTVAAQVQATVQALGRAPSGSAATPASATAAPSTRATVVTLPIVLDEHFVTQPQGWPDDADGIAWASGGVYHLSPRQDGHFVALGAPLIGALGDVVISATFHKLGGPAGGGFGLIVRDQNADSRDGTAQGGRFVVAEIGDTGTIGIWRREDDHWVDLVPWTPSTAVHAGDASNELTVQTLGDDITVLANGTQVARALMGVDKGGVGVFVGGDGNQVALERFTVRTDSQVRPRPTPPPPTATPLPPEPTATSVPAPTPTLVPVPTTPVTPSRTAARYLDPRELAADPNAHVNSNIWLQGRVLTVSHHDEEKGLFGTTPSFSWIQLLAQVQGKSTTESVVVRVYPKDPKILRDECYKFYGVVTGSETVTRTLTGASNEAPAVRGYAWEKAPVTQYGTCSS